MHALKEALRKRRMEKLAAMNEMDGMEGQEMKEEGLSAAAAPKDNTDHALMSQDLDGEDEGALSEEEEAMMLEHMTSDMSDFDMDHAMNSKPKSLGERVRQHAAMKAKQGK